MNRVRIRIDNKKLLFDMCNFRKFVTISDKYKEIMPLNEKTKNIAANLYMFST